jgi:hypothetical protein
MILKLKKYDKTKYYLNMAKNMINDIINDNKTSKEFKKYIKLSYKSLL